MWGGHLVLGRERVETHGVVRLVLPLQVVFTKLGVALAMIFVSFPFVVRTMQPVLAVRARAALVFACAVVGWCSLVCCAAYTYLG